MDFLYINCNGSSAALKSGWFEAMTEDSFTPQSPFIHLPPPQPTEYAGRYSIKSVLPRRMATGNEFLMRGEEFNSIS